MNNNKQFWIGFDIGGTKMLALILDSEYNVVGRLKRMVGVHRDNETITASIIDIIQGVLRKSDITTGQLSGIALATAGIIDVDQGIIEFTPNLHLKNLPLRSRLEAAFELPVLIENDANSGVYGEFMRGAAQGFRHVVGIFIGTGVGGGIIVDGRLYTGARGSAAEIGHIVVHPDGHRCNCGKYGCLEAYVSRKALAKELVGLAAMGDSPTIQQLAGTDMAAIKSRVIMAAVEAREPAVIEMVNRSAYYLGIGMANCASIFNPEMIVLGGGLVGKLGSGYIDVAEQVMRQHVLPQIGDYVEVRPAALGDNAVAIGVVAQLRGKQEREHSK